MILIADGGSTKVDWIFLDEEGNEVCKTRSLGLNPAVFSDSVIKNRIEENTELLKYKNSVDKLYFYGAGCGTDIPKQNLSNRLTSFFSSASIISVKEDTYAAVYAVTTEPSIVCILGTGSNSCYFDGEKIHVKIPSLGYVLMDEASGNHFGKKLVRDYYYEKMPKEVALGFSKQYDLSPDTIKRNIYREENPNSYLANFAEYIFTNERNDYFDKILQKGIKEFFKNRILPYKESRNLPIHFVGSIAHFSREFIIDIARYYRLNLGKIVRRPIQGLVEYHRLDLRK